MIAEYEDYTTSHPELIPAAKAEAHARLAALLDVGALERADHGTFTRGWWALFWLFPGLNPDDYEFWPDDLQQYTPLVVEAFRRRDEGWLSDSLLYPADAAHNRIWRERDGIRDHVR